MKHPYRHVIKQPKETYSSSKSALRQALIEFKQRSDHPSRSW